MIRKCSLLFEKMQSSSYDTLSFSGTVYGSLKNQKITFNKPVNLRPGVNKISLLSVAVGLPVRSLSLYICIHIDTTNSCEFYGSLI